MCFPLIYYFSIEHKFLFIPIGLYFIRRHVWKVKIFHKTVHNAWNLFKQSEQLTENSTKNSVFTTFDRSRVPFDWSNALFDWLNRNQASIEIGKNSKIDFLTISINWAKVLTDRKYWILNFHLENSRTWIFTLSTLWKNTL